MAVKLSPFYTSLAHFARRLDEAGADGLVLFNRFYQPDIDLEELEALAPPRTSPSSARAAAAAALAGDPLGRGCGLAGRDRRRPRAPSTRSRRSWPAPTPCRWSRRCCADGPGAPRTACATETVAWMEEHEYESLDADAGQHEPRTPAPTPRVYERANYMLMLQEWRGSVRNDG